MSAVVGVALMVAAVGTMWTLNVGSAPDAQVSRDIDATAIGLAHDFINGYIESDGRVVRRDEGGDVVSEGQSYGMLISAAVGDEWTFRRVWAWTKSNLARPDGLLAWRWYDGAITDHNSASDADVDAIRALLLAGRRFHAAELTADGWRMANVVMAEETVEFASPNKSGSQTMGSNSLTAGTGRVLVAGNWAATSAPQQVNVSYFNPRAEQELAGVDARWAVMSSTHRMILMRLASQMRVLPDWVAVDDGTINPIGHGDAPVRSGLDSARVAIRMAESCEHGDRQIAAALRAGLDAAPTAVGIRHLDGTPAVEWKHPISLVAAAAADQASGDQTDADAKLSDAQRLLRDYPSYYGAAWLALGYIMLRTNMFGACDTTAN